jgi:hypothetical protein
MRKFALIAVLALACSAEDFAPEEQDLVIGQTEQAMFLPFAYGHESNSTPCVAPFDPHCEVPRYRKVDLNIYTNSCSRALVKDQMMDAGAAMRNFYNALGWNILTWENTKGNRSSSVQVEIKCQTPPAGNNSLAGTNNVYENYGNCINAGSSNGFVCRYTPSFISVYDRDQGQALLQQPAPARDRPRPGLGAQRQRCWYAAHESILHERHQLEFRQHRVDSQQRRARPDRVLQPERRQPELRLIN